MKGNQFEQDVMPVKWNSTVQKGKLVQSWGLVNGWRVPFTGSWLQKVWRDCRKSLPHPFSRHPFAASAVLTAILVEPYCKLCRGLIWAAVVVFLTLNLHQLASPAPSRGSPNACVGSGCGDPPAAWGRGWARNVSSCSCPRRLLLLPALGKGSDTSAPLGCETTWASVIKSISDLNAVFGGASLMDS